VKNLPKVNTLFNNSPKFNSGTSGWNTPIMWFVGFLIVFLIIFSIFYDKFMNSLTNLNNQLNIWLTGYGNPPQEKQENIPVDAPVAPQDEASKTRSGMSSIVEKLLPPGKEVFTISKNNYSYYDAAPLCKALGAELATYEQVKQAWQNGADWCNYGWVKGQMAVFPTQSSTYEELQQGPEDQKGACGKPGLNGGYFDNPDLRFGVTCYGMKPSESSTNALTHSKLEIPLSTEEIEFEKKVQKFREQLDTTTVDPWNRSVWSSS
jgi:hypothetical protein